MSLQQAVEADRVVKCQIPHFLDNRFTDVGEVASLTRLLALLSC
jgi:hypothetical protein